MFFAITRKTFPCNGHLGDRAPTGSQKLTIRNDPFLADHRLQSRACRADPNGVDRASKKLAEFARSQFLLEVRLNSGESSYRIGWSAFVNVPSPSPDHGMMN